jgi:hypothetical protein
VSLRGDLTERVSAEVHYEADVISAASVDVVSAASPRGFEEVRHGLGAGLEWSPEPEVRFAVRYLPSWERDYRSHGIVAESRYEWLDRRLVQELLVRLNIDRVGRAGEPEDAWRPLSTLIVSGALSWVFDRKTVGSIRYEVSGLDGFQASPYRFVPIDWLTVPSGVSVPERHPEWRARHAAAVSVRRALKKNWFWSVEYRLYGDNWGVSSHTGSSALEHAINGDDVLLGADVRAYYQDSASFYSERYIVRAGVIPELRSRDKLLAESWSLMGGLRAEAVLGSAGFIDELRVVVRGDIYDQHFVDFAPLERRTALVPSLGAAAEF